MVWLIYCTHTHTHTFNGPLSRTTWVSWYQKGKPSEARDSEWQWHQLSHMQVCTSLQTDTHASTPPISFLRAGCPSCRPTNSVKALKAELNLLHWSRNRKIRKWMENGNQHSSEEVVQVILNSFKRRDCPVAYSCWCCEWSRRKCVVISAVRH